MMSMRYFLLILLLISIFLLGVRSNLNIRAQPSTDKNVYINLYVEEYEEYMDFNIPAKGVKFSPDLSKKDWHPFPYIYIEIKNMDLKKAVNKIYTNGYIYYGGYSSWRKLSYLYILPSPGLNDIFIKPKDGIAFHADIYVCYGYEKLIRKQYRVATNDPSIRVLKFNVPYNDFKNTFPKMDWCSVNIYWKGGCELISLKNPDNIDILNMPKTKIKDNVEWGWNYLSIYIEELVDNGLNVDGEWTLRFKEFDKDTPHLYQYPDIAVFLYDRICKENTIDLPPGVEITVKLENYMPTNLPNTWHLFREAKFYIDVEKGNINDLEVRDTFYTKRSKSVSCYLYKRIFILRNKGISTLKLYIRTSIGIATQLDSKTTYDGNLVTVKFNVPPPRDLPLYVPGEERYLEIYLYHPGFWKQVNLYTPYDKPAQEYIEVHERWLYSLVPVYGGNNLRISLSTGKKPFDGWWTYKAYIPMVMVNDPLKIVDLKPPALTRKVFRRGDKVWAHYSLGEKTYINITEKIIGADSTRYVFKNWIGNYYNGSDTLIKKSFDNADLIYERYNYDIEYYLKVISEKGSVSGEGWYLKDSQATISISPTEIMEGNNIKYIFSGWSGDISSTEQTTTVVMDGPKTITANWKKQYLVVVQSEYGSVSGAGWYDEGSTVTISVSPTETGFPIKKVFDYWSVDGQTYRNPSITIAVNKPLTAIANWREDYTLLYIIIGVVAVIAIILIIVLIKITGRKRREEYPPVPPVPPPPPPPPST